MKTTELPINGDYFPRANLTTRARQTIASSKELRAEARAWISDNDVPMHNWKFDDVLDFIEAYYSGGVIEFYLNSRTLTPTTQTK